MSNKYNEDIKNMGKQLEEYKNIIKKLENENFLINNRLKENKNILEKEQKINVQKSQIAKYLNNDLEIKNKYEILLKKYDVLLKEKNELDKMYQQIQIKNNNYIYIEQLETVKEQNKYILNLLLKITPNPNLIKQIIELNKEIIQLERKKNLIMNNKTKDKKINNIIIKINEQINKCKNNLTLLEDELINVDFGSSRSNNENSLNVSS